MDNAVVDDAVEETVVGVRPKRRKPVKPVVRVILAAAVCAVVVLDILSSHPSYFLLVYPALLGGSQLWMAKRPPTVISPSGIRRPWRKVRFLSWQAVDFIAAPGGGCLRHEGDSQERQGCCPRRCACCSIRGCRRTRSQAGESGDPVAHAGPASP